MAAALGLFLCLLGCSSPNGAGGGQRSESHEPPISYPLEASGGGVRNVTFYYDGRTPLRPGADLGALGSPSIVVTTPRPDETGAVRAIHERGALAFRYIQFYWAPSHGMYEGIDLGRNRGWAFCGSGDEPMLGRTTSPAKGEPVKWYFLDVNEHGLRRTLSRILQRYRDLGWDGVMLDRGGAATQNAVDYEGRPVWYARSSCTQDPYRPGARFADAYMGMLPLIRRAGLKIMVNTGTSPFDPEIPFRPDPRDQACRARNWASCHFSRQDWQRGDIMLDESVSFPRDVRWRRSFISNQRAENAARAGRYTVGLITTYTLGGRAHQTRSDVFYEWARAKLFNLPMAVNTGNDNCDGSRAGVCNRFGSYPELVDADFGDPTTTGPSPSLCQQGSRVQCVWKRNYTRGINLVNVSPEVRLTTIRLDNAECRYVYDVFANKPLANNTCVSRFPVLLSPWTGRPLLYSRKPWS